MALAHKVKPVPYSWSRTSFGLRRRSGKTYAYQRKVDVDMLNAVKSMLADVSSVSPSSGTYIAAAASVFVVGPPAVDVMVVEAELPLSRVFRSHRVFETTTTEREQVVPIEVNKPSS